MKKRLLFISHDATRTGAPILLLNLIRILRTSGYEISTLVKRADGPLLNEFVAASRCHDIFYRERPSSILARAVDSLLGFNSFNIPSRDLLDADMVISNTITNGDVLPLIRKRSQARLVTYVHELAVASKTFTTTRELDCVIECSDLFLAPSNVVRNFLIEELNVSPASVHLLNYYVPAEFSGDGRKMNADTFTVGGCGTADWRKGFDIFILIAKRVAESNANIRFRWKGIPTSSDMWQKARHDIKKLGLTDRIKLQPSAADTSEFYKTLDVFVLPSREDPYPLVVLEAAAAQVPTVCFDQAGGAVEFVEADAGKIVDYLSVDKMSDAILAYYNDRDLLQSHSRRAFEKLQARHQDANLIVKQFETAVRDL